MATSRKEKTMPYNCDGCGILFDLPINRYKAKRAWGKRKFYHQSTCVRSVRGYWDGPIIDYDKKISTQLDK